MELLVFGSSGTRVLVFPTRQGRFYDYENWGQVAAVSDFVEGGRLQLYCVDSIDSESLYCPACPAPARILRHNHYERYILEEVLPFSREKNPDSPLVAHGCSIGAFHAVNLSLRHPRHFSKAVGFSGRYDLSRSMGPFPDLFRGHYDEDIYFHTPTHYVPNLHDPALLEQLRRLEVVLAVGNQDPFQESNHTLSRQLGEKGVPNQLYVWDGEAHRARYWASMARYYLAG